MNALKQNEYSNRQAKRDSNSEFKLTKFDVMTNLAKQEPSIEVWIEEAAQGNANAFRAIYDAYFERVVRHVGRIIGTSGEVEDVTQEVFVQVFRSIKNFRFECKFSTWLYRLTYNVSVSYLRRKPRTVELAAYRPLAESNGMWAKLEARDLVRVLEAALKQVPIEHREAFLLHEVDGYKLREISELTDESVNTIASRVRRTREQMQQILESTMKLPKENL